MMRKFSKYLFVHALMTAVLLYGCIGAVGAAEPAAMSSEEIGPAIIQVVPLSGVLKTKVAVYGAGFVPGEKVKVIINAGGVPLQWAASGTGGVVTANERGAFKLKPRGGIPRAPAVMKPGVYTIRAVGNKGSRATAVLEVLEKK